MSLILADRAVQKPADLSQPALLVLSCIDGGNEWLGHAITAAKRYAFEDEMALVVAAQQGLHGTPLVLLPKLGLMAGAARLIALSADELRTLLAVETGQEPTDAPGAQALLAQQGLATASDLAGGDALLKSLGVAGSPLFQTLALGERIALLGLKDDLAADGAPPLAAQKAAARFAAEWSYSPLEFVDYLRSFLALTNGTDPLSAEDARAALAALTPMLFDTLDCPAVRGFISPQELAMALAAWIGSGHRVGFTRLSHAVWQLVAHGGYRGQKGAEASGLITAHLDQIQAVLTAATLDRARIHQDGSGACFTAHGGETPGEVELLLDANGTITIQRFERTPITGDSR